MKIFKGDDTGGRLGKALTITVHTKYDLTNCLIFFNYQGITRKWEGVKDGDTLDLFFSHNETARMSVGTFKGVMFAIDPAGKYRTIDNAIPITVTTSLRDCYGDDHFDVVVGVAVDWNNIVHKPFEGQTIDLSTDDKMLAALGTIIEKLGGTVKTIAILALASFFVSSAFAYDPPVNDKSYTTNGVTYSQRGGLGVKDYVVTNISIKASDIGAVEDNDDYQIVKSNATTAVQPSAISDMETKTHASDTYQPKGNYLTRETDPTVPAWAKQPNPPEGMTDNALVLTDDKVQTKGGDENLGEASLGTLHVSRIYNNDAGLMGPVYITSPWMYAFVDKFIIGKTDQNPDGAYNVTIDEAGISAFNGESYFGFAQGRSGMIALENWQSLSAMLDNAGPSNLAANQTFSDAVLNVGLNIDTNSVAVLNEIAETFGGFPITGTATTVGGLLAALAAAVAWLKKNKVQTLKLEDGSVETSADGGVAKLDDFFTNSNSLLTATIDARLPYPLYAVPSTGLLKDRAFNTLTFDGTEYNLSTALESVTPTASGQPRDLLIVATATAATTISFTAGTIKGDKPTIDGEGTWLITLTEYASGVWYCRQIKMEDAA